MWTSFSLKKSRQLPWLPHGRPPPGEVSLRCPTRSSCGCGTWITTISHNGLGFAKYDPAPAQGLVALRALAVISQPDPWEFLAPKILKLKQFGQNQTIKELFFETTYLLLAFYRDDQPWWGDVYFIITHLYLRRCSVNPQPLSCGIASLGYLKLIQLWSRQPCPFTCLQPASMLSTSQAAGQLGEPKKRRQAAHSL